MRFVPIFLAATVAATSAMAGPNLVTNGSFENVTSTPNFEFGTDTPVVADQNAVVGWSSTGSNAYNLLFSPTTAWTAAGNARGQYQGTGLEYLRGSGVASPDGGNFVALDGDVNASGPLTQTINGLTAGKTYTLSFYWASDQVESRNGPTTEKIQTTIGSDVFSTPLVTNNDGAGNSYFTGWEKWTTTFTASGSSELLSFLSVGTPSGLPPIALLDGVSITQNVPEPGALALLGLGGLGLAAVARRRK